MSPATTTMWHMPVYTATQASDSSEIRTHLSEWIPRGGEEPFLLGDPRLYLKQAITDFLDLAEQSGWYGADALGLEPKTVAVPQHFGIEGWHSSSRSRGFLFCSGQPLNPESAADPVLTKLQELAELPLGWDYGEGRPTLPHVYQTARALYQALAPFQLKADAFPCPDGSLYLVFYVGLRSVEIRIWADETIDLSVEEDLGKHVKELVSREDISEHEAKNQVIYQVIYLLLGQELFQWESSGSFIPDTTISNSLGFAVHSLPTQAMELASRSSTPIVSVRQAHRSANTSPSTIPGS